MIRLLYASIAALDRRLNFPSRIGGGHQYIVVGYNSSTQTVTLFNPWGINNGSEYPGLVNMTLSQIDARTRGVLATVQLRRERSPRDIEAGAGGVWVVCFDGSVVRVPEHAGAARTTDTGGALVGAAASGPRAWVAATALDQGQQETSTR